MEFTVADAPEQLYLVRDAPTPALLARVDGAGAAGGDRAPCTIAQGIVRTFPEHDVPLRCEGDAIAVVAAATRASCSFPVR
jgi:hypothetical protein